MTMKTQPTTRETRAFVDEIDGETARLLVGDDTVHAPSRLLPPAAREGTWIRLFVEVLPAPPNDTAALRRKLGKSDPGGPIKL